MTITSEMIDEMIEKRISGEYIHYLPVTISVDIPDAYNESVNAIIESMKIICGKAHINKKIHIIVGGNPVILKMSNSTLKMKMKPGVIHCVIEANLVFLNLDAISELSYPMKVATILEELVHALMNIRCEKLVSEVVSAMYEGITLNEKKQYTPTTELTGSLAAR